MIKRGVKFDKKRTSLLFLAVFLTGLVPASYGQDASQAGVRLHELFNGREGACPSIKKPALCGQDCGPVDPEKAAAMVVKALRDKFPQEDAKELTPETLKAIDRGLEALAKGQNKDGSFGNGSAPVATTALSGLAFLAGGHTPNRSKYSGHLDKALQYILRHAERSGYINEGTGSRGSGSSSMHGHGYALLFLTQIYGMVTDEEEVDRMHEAIVRAVRLIEGAQAQNGGWTYEPRDGGDEGSVTVTQVQALRAARDIGVAVNIQTIKKAIDYINHVTDAQGQTGYSWTSVGGGGAALTGAGMCVLTYLGEYQNPKIEKGLDYLLKDCKPDSGAWSNYYFYGGYYATLAMYHKGGNYWQAWWPAMRDALLNKQDRNSGLWTTGESGNYGPAFGTSLALLMLQVPKRQLPIFQRGKD